MNPLNSPISILFCEGETFTLTPISENGISGTWSPELNNTATTTYTFTPNDIACSTTTEMVVDVYATPTGDIFGSVTVCQYDDSPMVTLTANGNADDSFVFVYTSGDGTYLVNSEGNSIEIEVPTDESGVYTYTFDKVINGVNANCYSEINETVTITVNESINGTTETNIEACIGDAVSPEVILEGQNGTAPYTFTYTINDGAPETITSNNGFAFVEIPTTNSGDFIVKLIEIQDDSEGNCHSIINPIATVTIHSLPTISAGENISICAGGTVTLNGFGGTNYDWNNGITNNVPFTPSSTTTYQVIGTDENGCQNTDEVTVTITTLESPSFEVDVTKGCTPLTVNFTNTSEIQGDCSYSINNSTTLQGCHPTTILSQPGCYEVTLTITTSDGCASSTTIEDIVCVSPIPIAEFSFDSPFITEFDNEVYFNNSSSNADAYTWSFGDGTSSHEINPIHSYQPSGSDYIVNLIAKNEDGCIDSIVAVINVHEELIYYVPNAFTPDGNKYNEVFEPVFTSGFDPLNYHLTIMNRWGEALFESYDHNVGWDGTFKGAIVPEGVYSWKIEFGLKNFDKNNIKMGSVTVIK